MIPIQGGQFIVPLALFITLQLSLKLAYSCGPGRGGYWKRAGKPLVLYERVPKLGELSEGGSGPAKGKITRNTPEFAKLATVWKTDIVFKDEERSGADRIMTKVGFFRLFTLGILSFNTFYSSAWGPT